MPTKADLDAPADLAYPLAGPGFDPGQIDWSAAKTFPSLREALHVAMNEEPPAGRHAVIRAASGRVLLPDALDEIWASLQGP